MKNFFRVFFSVVLFFVLCPINNVSAATVYVNSSTGNDTTGDGSSSTPYKTFHKGYTEVVSGDTLDLTGTFTWTDADETGDVITTGYTIGKNLTIQGQGATQTIFQSASSENTADRRIFTISLGNTVNINSSTIRYGKVGSNQNGGGIYIEGIANINYSDISYNRAPDGSGGGADVRGSLTIQNSTVHHNVAHYMGGGLNRDYYSGSGGTPGASDLLDIINSTISYNQVTQTVAYLEGGGVFYRRGSGSITNSTISYNQIVNGEGTSSHGVGTGDAGCVVQLKNNIIAENILTNCWSGEIGHRSSGGGTFTDNGGNIISKLGYYIDGYTAAATSWVDQANGCASPDGTYILQDGGSTSGQLNTNSTLALNSSLYETMTHAITVGTSISVNNGLTGVNGSISVPSTDQRGASRNGNTDIGAFEYAGIFGPPVVNSLSPTDGATGIAVSANLIITFDETVDVEAGANNDIVIKKVSDNSTVETIDSEDAKITGTGTAVITVNPATTLDESTAYYVQIGADAFDDTESNSYTGISDTTTWNFTTGDFTNPTISTLSPTDGATGIAVNANLIITFDEEVDRETGNITIYKTSDDSTVETIDVTSGLATGTGTTIITINPTSDLAEQTGYYVQVDATAFDDTSSNSFAGISASTTWNFTTGDFTGPTVSTLSPTDGATGIAIDANLVITFDEAVDAESGNITIYKTSDDSVVEAIDVTSGLVTGTGTTAITINPSSDFAYETEYYVFIATTAFDDSLSNSYAGISASTTWNFTIVDTPLCTTLSNVSTYNAYPTCGAASCNTGYSLSGSGSAATCITMGGGSYIAFVPPPRPQIQINSNSNDSTNGKTRKAGLAERSVAIVPVVFTRTLKKGMQNNDVKKLQEFLATDPSIYPEGLTTGYFGELTEKAVQRFQTKHNIVSSGTPQTTGYGLVGPKTRAKLLSVLKNTPTTLIKTVVTPEAPAVISTPVSSVFNIDLQKGSYDLEVKQLQEFLNTDPNTQISSTGEGSPGNETTFFGSLTEKAVQKFQTKHGIVSSGTPDTTGFGRIGPKTRQKLNELIR